MIPDSCVGNLPLPTEVCRNKNSQIYTVHINKPHLDVNSKQRTLENPKYFALNTVRSKII